MRAEKQVNFEIRLVLQGWICSDSSSHNLSELFVLRYSLTSCISLPLSMFFFLLRALFSTLLTWKTPISHFSRFLTVLFYFLISFGRKKKTSLLCVPIVSLIYFCFCIFHKIIICIHICLPSQCQNSFKGIELSCYCLL